MNSCGYELGVAKAARSGAYGTAVRLMLYSQMVEYGKNSRLTRYARGGTERDGPTCQSRRAATTRLVARPSQAESVGPLARQATRRRRQGPARSRKGFVE